MREATGNSLRRMCFGGLLGIASIAHLTGCGRAKTMREFSVPYNEQMDALVVDMEALSSGDTLKVLYKEDFNYWKQSFEPKPYFHIADGKSNTAIVNFEQLLGLSSDLGESIDLYLTSTLEHLLEDRFLAEPPMNERFFEEVPFVAKIRYFVVYSPLGFKQAIIFENEQQFVIEPLNMAVGLYDRESKEWLMLKHFLVEPPENLEYTYRETNLEEDAQFALRDYYAEKVQPLIVEWLEESTGGTIETEMRAPRQDGTALEF